MFARVTSELGTTQAFQPHKPDAGLLLPEPRSLPFNFPPVKGEGKDKGLLPTPWNISDKITAVFTSLWLTCTTPPCCWPSVRKGPECAALPELLGSSRSQAYTNACWTPREPWPPFQRGSSGLLCDTMKRTPCWVLLSSSLRTPCGDRARPGRAGRLGRSPNLRVPGGRGAPGRRCHPQWQCPSAPKARPGGACFPLESPPPQGGARKWVKIMYRAVHPSVHSFWRVSFLLTWRTDSRSEFEIWLQKFLNSITSQAGTVITRVIKQFKESG